MSVTHPRCFWGGVLVLVFVWVWPLSVLGLPPFSTHMVMHMAVVAIAAPLLALGVAQGRLDLVRHYSGGFSAVPVSVVELVVVWAWHTPRLHHAARTDPRYFFLEQSTFLVAGSLLWLAALGGTPAERRRRSIGGTAGLLLTSMHMTLLGALIGLTPRVLYQHGHHPGAHAHHVLTPLQDQQLGGAIMLFLGAAAYLLGGVGLMADALRAKEPRRENI
jgi:putative membrane protein